MVRLCEALAHLPGRGAKTVLVIPIHILEPCRRRRCVLLGEEGGGEERESIVQMNGSENLHPNPKYDPITHRWRAKRFGRSASGRRRRASISMTPIT